MLIRNNLFNFVHDNKFMTKPFSHWQNFVIGILIGIIAGGTIVWLEMKDANRNFLSQILFELNTLKLEKKIADNFKKIIYKVFPQATFKYFEAHLYPPMFLKIWKIYEKIMESIIPKRFLAYNVSIIKK